MNNDNLLWIKIRLNNFIDINILKANAMNEKQCLALEFYSKLFHWHKYDKDFKNYKRLLFMK